MAKRGPKPTPINILQMRGSWRGDLKKSENKVPDKAPKMPSGLSKEAQKEWRRIVRILKARGNLNEMDYTFILTHCLIHAAFIEVLEYIEEMGKKSGRGTKGLLLTQTDKGNIIQNPIIGILHTRWKMLCQSAKNLGIPPSGRTNIEQPKAENEEELKKERFFKNKKPG